MTSSYVVDRSGVLGKLQRTATGGYRVPATLARAGVMSYSDGKGGTVRHYNPASVLEAALSDIVDAPVTFDHPAQMVTPQTYKAVAAGHVVGAPSFQDGHVHATLAVQDANLLQALELGSCREVSMGYSVDYEENPGVTPEGEAYDVVRTAIRWNHIALVAQGRAGRSVRCMLDSQDIPTEEVNVTYMLDGAEVAQDKVQAALDALCGTRDAAIADAAGLKAQLEDAQAKLAAALSAEAIDAAVQARLDAADALKRRAEVAKIFPKLDLEGKSQDYVDALYDARAKDPDGLEALSGRTTVVDAPAKSEERKSARERMIEANRAK